MFDKLIWHKDRMILDDLVFRLQHYKNDDWELGDDCFVFFKIKALIDQYAKFWALRKDFRAQNVLELGMFDGGSVAFWFEYFQPEKHVGVDIQPRQDSVYFQQYIASKGISQRIKTYWHTNQADSAKLREIVEGEFAGPLDLVIDDASHMYDPTKASFETLFPLLRPGGLYIIEDWAWSHWQEFQAPDHPWATKTPLTKLIFELIEATGTNRATSGLEVLIENVTTYQGFTVVERGGYKVTEPAKFKLEHFISRRAVPSQTPSEQLIASKIAHINHLEQKLATIQGSRAWRLVSKWYGFRDSFKRLTVKQGGEEENPATITNLSISRNDSETLIFVHIPKTAGVSLNHILDQYYKPTETFSVRLGKDRKTFKSLPYEERAKINLLRGHIAFGAHKFLSRPTIYMTVLRNPIDRTISHYYFVLQETTQRLHDKAKSLDLADFVLNEPEVQNLQTKMLAGIENIYQQVDKSTLKQAKENLNSCAIIGLTERFEDTLALMENVLGWQNIPSVEKRQVTKSRPSISDVPESTIKIIKEYNQLDIELYEYAKKLFEESIKKLIG